MSILDEVCANPHDTLKWGEWKEAFKTAGVDVLDDDSGFLDEKELTAAEARAAATRCTVRQMCVPTPMVIQGPKIVAVEPVVLPPPVKLTVTQWRREFQNLLDNPPVKDFILRTVDGGPLRIEVELTEGRPPLMYARAYVPKIVGEPLGWFGQGRHDKTNYGWKVILLPKSRDEAIKRLGIAKNVVAVQAVRTVKMSDTRQSILGEIIDW